MSEIEKAKRGGNNREALMTKHAGVRLDNNTWDALSNIAKKEEASVSDIIRHACKMFVAAH